MKKRDEKDIWQNLYDFPLIETEQAISENELIGKLLHLSIFNSKNLVVKEFSQESIQLLSHQKLHIRFIKVRFSFVEKEEFTAYSKAEIEHLPLPRPIERYLSQILSD